MNVVVTGMSVWCATGRDLDEFDHSLRRGLDGRRSVTRFDVSHPAYRTHEAATLLDEESLTCEIDDTRLSDLAYRLSERALADAQLDGADCDRSRFGVGLATSHGGNIAFSTFLKGRLGLPGGRIDHRLLLSGGGTIVGQTAARIGAAGPTFTISTACASGTNSIGRAAELIADHRADVMVAGGVDLFTELSFSGFNILGATARGACRPFDRDRDGMMLGDGAAMVVLESEEHARRRNAQVWVTVSGHAIANDAYHATAPEPGGAETARVMSEALQSAGLSPDDVDYVNLHGTGTVANDEAELQAVARVFGDHASQVFLSSTKSMVGHTLGAAGSVEFVATALGMAHGYVPPSINLEHPIDGYETWRFVRDRAAPADLKVAMSNSLGFAGNLSSIVLEHTEGARA